MAAAAKRRFVHAKVVPVNTKENFRRPVPKTYSYRYEVGADAGPLDDPLVRKGAAIIESRYRGRGASWNIGRSMVDPVTYLVKGSYVHPLEDNPMAYPPRSVPAAEKQTRTPGFAASSAQKVVRRGGRIDSNVPPPRPGSIGTPPATPPPLPGPTAAPPMRRDTARPTPANEPAAYRKTG
jgi:hypothetical protein